MKRFKFDKRKVTAICIGTFLAGIVSSGTALATELDVKVSEEFEKWNNLTVEEKQETFMPQTYSVEVPESILKEYSIESEVPSVISGLLGKSKSKIENSIGSVSSARYNIADNLNIRVENQGITTECWAFSMLKSMETNIALRNGTKDILDFSERHMDYATSRTFLDGVNDKAFKRELKSGGLPVSGLAYLTNGQGAVLEQDMPFENNEEKIYLSEIDKPVDTIVTEYNTLPSIYKDYEHDSNGNTIKVTYTDGSGNEYTSETLEAARNIIKQHIVEDGAIPSLTAANIAKYYNHDRNVERPSVFKATTYNCNSKYETRDHAITIVGWDDNYSRDNFVEGAKPSTDGAYIVLNSYGTENFDNGYIYISYEDYFIESELYSIINTSKKDYDNIYQSDFYGGIFAIGTTSTDTGYFSNTFKRGSSEEEYVKSVGVTVCDYVTLEIYIDENGSDKAVSSLTKIGETTTVLEPGYHRINVTPTKINGEEFTIVIKQKSVSDKKFYFSVEAPVLNTPYEYVSSENMGAYSIDGETWMDLASLNISNFDIKKTDVCIKAFTTVGENKEEPGTNPEVPNPENPNPENPNPDPGQNPDSGDDDETLKELTSSEYLVKSNEVYKITFNTKINDFKTKVQTDFDMNLYYEGNEIVNGDEVIKNGTILKLSNGKEYELIVRGDLNCDGNITITDLSKMILHYNENRGFVLTGAAAKAADMNFDDKTSITDVSQMIVLYNSL